MIKIFYLFPVFFLIINCLPGMTNTAARFSPVVPEEIVSDTIDVQILYNGRLWRNLYNGVDGDQFLFTPEFLSGSVTIDGISFDSLQVKYDIYNDELLLLTDRGIILQLNKEMIDLFSIKYNNQIFHFKRFDPDSLNTLSGYVNVLYDDSISLYVKYWKYIIPPTITGSFNMFSQNNWIYVSRKGDFYKVDTKAELLRLLKDQNQLVRNFIRTNKIRISRKNPESFHRVIEYYDNLPKKSD
jgi:hypothetical protein